VTLAPCAQIRANHGRTLRVVLSASGIAPGGLQGSVPQSLFDRGDRLLRSSVVRLQESGECLDVINAGVARERRLRRLDPE
jgi:hypothetical protein